MQAELAGVTTARPDQKSFLNPQDECSVTVHLTDAGTALRDQALRVPPRILASTGLTPSEITGLQTLLNRVTAHIDTTDSTGNRTG